MPRVIEGSDDEGEAEYREPGAVAPSPSESEQMRVDLEDLALPEHSREGSVEAAVGNLDQVPALEVCATGSQQSLPVIAEAGEGEVDHDGSVAQIAPAEG
jgi:hypothetical protein